MLSRTGSQKEVGFRADGQRQPFDESGLVEMFICKLELERLCADKLDGKSKSESALQMENKVLKERLRQLRQNIAILNSMIDEIKNGYGQNTEIEIQMKGMQPQNDQNDSAIFQDYANEISDLQLQNGALSSKDLEIVLDLLGGHRVYVVGQNDRLMSLNHRLMLESEQLRKEIQKLRELLGDDNSLMRNLLSQGRFNLEIEITHDIEQLHKQLKDMQQVCQYLQTKNTELEGALQKANEFERENIGLKDQIRKRNDELSNEREIANDLRDRLESLAGQPSVDASIKVRIEELEKQLRNFNDLKVDFEELNTTNLDLNQKIKELGVELEDVKRELLTKEEKLKDFEEASLDLRNQLDSNRQSLSSQKDLETENQQLKSRLKESLRL